MEQSLSASDANSYYTSRFHIQEAQKTCFSKCVVDFQTNSISAMEKECAKSCITKNLAIMKDLKAISTL